MSAATGDGVAAVLETTVVTPGRRQASVRPEKPRTLALIAPGAVLQPLHSNRNCARHVRSSAMRVPAQAGLEIQACELLERSSVSLRSCFAATRAGQDRATPRRRPGAGDGSGCACERGRSRAAGSADAAIDPASVKPEDMPTAVRMRRLEQKTQSLKERAWQLKARVQMLKEQMLGGGVGAQALIAHANKMGSSFRLIKLIVHARRHADLRRAPTRPRETSTRPSRSTSSRARSRRAATSSRSSRPIAATATACSSTSRSTRSPRAAPARSSPARARSRRSSASGFEKGGATTPMEKRPAIDCKVTEVSPEQAGRDDPTTPGRRSPLPRPPLRRRSACTGGDHAGGAGEMTDAMRASLVAGAGCCSRLRALPASRARTSAASSRVRARGAPARQTICRRPTSSRRRRASAGSSTPRSRSRSATTITAALTLFDLASKPGARATKSRRYYLGESLYQKGDKGAARTYFARSSSNNYAGKPYYQLVAGPARRDRDRSAGRSRPAEASLAGARSGGAGARLPDVPYVKGKYAFSQGKYDEALAASPRSPKGSDYELQALYYTGTTQVAKKDLAKATEIFTDLVDRSAAERRTIAA